MVDLKLLRDFQVRHQPEIEWDDKGKLATLRWLADDGTPITVTMPTTILARLQEDIGSAIERKPRPNRQQ